jgi:hypothetical protein
MCPNTLFTEIVLGPPENEKWRVYVSRLGRTRMPYVTRRSHQMDKHKFGVTCPNTHFTEIAPGPPEHEI